MCLFSSYITIFSSLQAHMFSLKSGIKCSENKLKHLEMFLSSENTKMNLTSELRRIGIIFSKLIFLTSKKSVFSDFITKTYLTWSCFSKHPVPYLNHTLESVNHPANLHGVSLGDSVSISAISDITTTEKVSLTVMLWTCDRKLLCSNLGSDTGYTRGSFRPGQYLDNTLIRPRPIPSNSLSFINHSIIPHYKI